MWWFVAAALLFVAWFSWQLFGPNPPLIVSKETTYITAPLRPDGLPDYHKYVRDKLRDGVTPENNAAALMWQAFGPGRGGDAVSPADWKQISRELRLPPAAASNHLDEPDEEDVTKPVEQWVCINDPAWKHATENPPTVFDGEPLPSDIGYDAVFAAMDAPWRREQLPPLAEWVEANRAALDLLVEASRRPRLYSPFESPADESKDNLLYTMPFGSIMRTRATARCLKLRSMLYLGEGQPEQAWQDLYAIHRWARLVGQGPTIIEQLVAMAIDGITCEGTTVLLSNDQLPLDVARQIQLDLLALSQTSQLAEAFDHGERLYFLDAIIAGRNDGIGTLLSDQTSFDESDSFQPLDYLSADWNTTLREVNRWYDQLAAACRVPTFSARKQAFSRLTADIQHMEKELHRPGAWATGAVNSTKRGRLFAAAVITSLSPVINANSDAEDRARTTLDLTRLAAALAVYRADHGQYPDKLETLVPDVLPKLPVDLYHAKPFVYQRDGNGYLLYSTGENGNDDGGSNEQYAGGILAGRELDWNDDPATEKLRQQIPAGADDLSIRLPRPPFELPSPPNNE